MNTNPYSTYVYYIINNKRFTNNDANEWQTALLNNEELPWIKKFTEKYKFTEQDLQVIKMYNNYINKPIFLYNIPQQAQLPTPIQSSIQKPITFNSIMREIINFINGLQLNDYMQEPFYFNDKLNIDKYLGSLFKKKDKGGLLFDDKNILDIERGLPNDNSFESDKVKNLSQQYNKSYQGKDFKKYQMAMYLKYLKYKSKYFNLKGKLH